MRLQAAGVAQRVAVVVPGHVQVSIAIYRYADAVVRVLYVSCKVGFFQFPFLFAGPSFAQHYMALAVVIGNVLQAAGGYDGILAEYHGIDAVACPTGACFGAMNF